MSGCHPLLVHAAAESFDVITDIGDHSVPFVALGRLWAFIRGAAVAASSCCSVAVGCRIGGGAGCASIAAKAVGDDSPAVFHANGLEEILEVLAVFLGYEGPQTYRSEGKSVVCSYTSFQHDSSLRSFQGCPQR